MSTPVTDNKTQQQLVAEISGRVKDVISKGKNKSVIVVTKTGNNYTIDLNMYFVLTHENDLLYAKCKFKNNNPEEKELYLIEDPFIILPVDSESVKHVFTKANTKHFTYDKADKLYDHIVNEAKSVQNVCTFLDDAAQKYNSNKDNLYIEYFKPICNQQQATNILEYWYKNRVLRQLYLLGLTNKEIYASKFDPTEIYKKCLENPFLVTNLTIEKCDKILLRQNKVASADDKTIAMVIRQIEKTCLDKSYTGIPTFYILYLWPKFVEYYPKLSNHYEIKGDMEMIYPKENYIIETTLAEKISNLIKAGKYEMKGEIKFKNPKISEDQKSAVIGALTNNLSIILGAAGTGKTTTIQEIVYNLELREIEYEVGSFTGKSVARLREVLGSNKPTTLDRLISKYKDKKFKYLIIDEISMVTMDLLYRILKQFTHDFVLIVVGDHNQLEPIGIGCLFNALLKTQLVQTFVLTTNFRVINESGDKNLIMSNITNMLNLQQGEQFKFETGAEFQTYHVPEYNNALIFVENILISLQKSMVNPDDITIVTAYNESNSNIGKLKYIDDLNKIFQKIFNPPTSFSIDTSGRVLLLNSRVTHNTNDYNTNLMNGEQGKIIECDQKYVKVKFSDNTTQKFSTEIINKDIDLNTDAKKDPDVSNLDISFATTCHKYQGSENKYTILFLPNNKVNDSFLTFNFLYTILTRARIGEYIVGDMNQVVQGIMRLPKKKYDKLPERIKLLCPEIEGNNLVNKFNEMEEEFLNYC